MKAVDGKVWSGEFFQMRQNPRMLTPEVSGFWSYPALVSGPGGQVNWLHLLLGTNTVENHGYLHLTRPKAFAVTLPHSSLLIEYRDLRSSEDPFPEIPWNKRIHVYPWKAARKISKDEMQKLETDLMLWYDRAAGVFYESNSLPPAFAELYTRLTHPIFLKLLPRLAAEFCSALRRATS
jgi:hypothetical protein